MTAEWGRGSGSDIGAHGVYNKAGTTNFHGNLFIDTTGQDATAIHALSGQVNLNHYSDGTEALAVITTAKDNAHGIYNNKAVVNAESHVIFLLLVPRRRQLKWMVQVRQH